MKWHSSVRVLSLSRHGITRMILCIQSTREWISTNLMSSIFVNCLFGILYHTPSHEGYPSKLFDNTLTKLKSENRRFYEQTNLAQYVLIPFVTNRYRQTKIMSIRVLFFTPQHVSDNPLTPALVKTGIFITGIHFKHYSPYIESAPCHMRRLPNYNADF